MVYECATCGDWKDGVSYVASDAPRDPWGRVERSYYDSDPPRYCSEQCRTAAEQKVTS